MIRALVSMLITGVVFIGLMIPAASADILLIEKVKERMARDLPENGLKMEDVESRFGTPAERHAPVGDPPITRWTYDDYSVYFEYELVIDSVLHHEAVVREANRQQD